jgi:hypothetical protein
MAKSIPSLAQPFRISGYRPWASVCEPDFHDTKALIKSLSAAVGGFDPVIAQFATRMSRELESGFGGALYSESMG